MLKILLLEDNDDDSLLVMRALRELATVERASSRDQFRNALSMPWDIIMLDFSLPQLNGDEALKLALERAPQTPIIVFSGTITVTKAVEVIKAGATDYIGKADWELLPIAVQRAHRERQDKLQLLRAQRMEDIGALASGIVHDLNNAVGPGTLAVSMLRPGLSEEQGRLLDAIEQSFQRQAEMLEQLLEFVRGTNGIHRPIALGQLLGQLLDFLRHTIGKSIELRHSIKANLPDISGNSTQLQQVILNLCINARDAMLAMGPAPAKPLIDIIADAIELRDHRLSNGEIVSGRYVHISVADNGPGMRPEIAARIFEPFFTTKKSGTGLGLANVLKIVKGHNGYIDLVTIPGIGTKFSVLLPAPTRVIGTHEAKAAPIPPHGNGRTLLLVDDEDGMRELTRTLLESYGYHVLAARSASVALALYRDHADAITVVVTDLMMPGMSGVALIGQLRAIEPEVKILCITGAGSNAEEVAAAKPDAALGKPFSAEQLLSKLQQVCGA